MSHCKLLHPGRLFVRLSDWAGEGASLGWLLYWSQILDLPEKLAMDKHSGLFGSVVSDEEKKFNNFETRKF